MTSTATNAKGRRLALQSEMMPYIVHVRREHFILVLQTQDIPLKEDEHTNCEYRALLTMLGTRK